MLISESFLKTKLWIRLISIYVIRVFLFIFYVFHINKKKIVFISSGGISYNCNPYAIYQYLHNKYPGDYDFYWYSKTMSRKGLTNTDHLLKDRSLSYVYHMLTAGVIITNNVVQAILPLRRKQIVINTWHGGGLFKKVLLPKEAGRFYADHLSKLHNKNCSIFLASSEAFATQAVRKTFNFRGKILNSGMPRNDIFFGETSFISYQVKKFYDIAPSDGIVLYAPTYRGSVLNSKHNWFRENAFDIPLLLQTLEKKYHKKFHLMFRAHKGIEEIITGFDCIDVSGYREMQELLVVADVFITDYSSSLWDFSFTYKPCFIYGPDIDEYAKFPGFETDPYKWPFPIAKDDEELVKNITNFDSSIYKKKVEEYHRLYNSYDKGTATKQVVEYIRRKQDLQF